MPCGTARHGSVRAGLLRRGPDSERKKIYASATTPDSYAAKYAPKADGFLAGEAVQP